MNEEDKKAMECAAKDNCVNDGHSGLYGSECGYDRDRRHFEVGATWGLERNEAASLSRAVEAIKEVNRLTSLLKECEGVINLVCCQYLAKDEIALREEIKKARSLLAKLKKRETKYD